MTGSGELSLGHIVAGGLSYLLFIIVIIEDIVTNLEDNTQLTAKELSTLHIFIGGSCRQSTDGRACLEESGGLVLDYVIIGFLRYFLIVDTRELENLAIRQGAAEFGKISYNLLGVGIRHI